jgi:hypothetical protein
MSFENYLFLFYFIYFFYYFIYFFYYFFYFYFFIFIFLFLFLFFSSLSPPILFQVVLPTTIYGNKLLLLLLLKYINHDNNYYKSNRKWSNKNLFNSVIFCIGNDVILFITIYANLIKIIMSHELVNNES